MSQVSATQHYTLHSTQYNTVLRYLVNTSPPWPAGWSVLLLEAGADESEASDIPVLANALQKGLFDWQYQVTDFCAGSVKVLKS